MKLIDKYVVSIELYSDERMSNYNGYFFNILTLYYSKNGKINTNDKTVDVSNRMSKAILKKFNLLPKNTRENLGLCYFYPQHLDYIEYICGLRNIVVAKVRNTINIKGKIYEYHYDNYADILNDMRFRLQKLENAIQHKKFNITNILY